MGLGLGLARISAHRIPHSNPAPLFRAEFLRRLAKNWTGRGVPKWALGAAGAARAAIGRERADSVQQVERSGAGRGGRRGLSSHG